VNVQDLRFLLKPTSVAVVGASQKPTRGTGVLKNLQKIGFAGDLFAVNANYKEVLGCPSFASVRDLPKAVDSIVLAVAAEAACDILEQAHERGIRSAVVLSAGFGEGGHGASRAQRLAALAAKGMAICGPNCFGILNLKDKVATYSGQIHPPLPRGPLALVSQSGGVANNIFSSLVTDRQVGFDYVVSCGNQLGVTVEDYIEYFVHDPDIKIIAVVIEAVQNPRKLREVAALANRQKKSIIALHLGRSAMGQIMAQTHTGALAGDSTILAAYLRHCGIVQAFDYDEFVEAIALFSGAPDTADIDDDLIVLSSSGGGAAIVADVMADDKAALPFAALSPATREALRATLPEFGSVTNPIDGTGAIFDNLELLPKLMKIILGNGGRSIIAASVSARPDNFNERQRHLARCYAAAASESGRLIVAYQPTPHGGLDREMLSTFRQAQVPFLLGAGVAMRTLKYIAQRAGHWRRAGDVPDKSAAVHELKGLDFLSARAALLEAGVPIVEASEARSEQEAIEHFRRFGTAVAVKADAFGLLHKSDVGCVRLNCGAENDVAAAFRHVTQQAKKAGFPDAKIIVQPMMDGICEVFAGITCDPLFGLAITFGIGGIFIEIMKDAVTEMAPLSRERALAMIDGIKAASLLKGARGAAPGDIDALAECLVNVSRFAADNAGQFRSLDLNPIIVRPVGRGVAAVDIAIEANASRDVETAPIHRRSAVL
jgi:acyl-CoA synthetase (NDP forming)